MGRRRIASCWCGHRRRTFSTPDFQTDCRWRRRWSIRLCRTLERRWRRSVLRLRLLLCRGGGKPLSWNEFESRGIEFTHLQTKVERTGQCVRRADVAQFKFKEDILVKCKI